MDIYNLSKPLFTNVIKLCRFSYRKQISLPYRNIYTLIL